MNKCFFSGFISSDIKAEELKTKDGGSIKKIRFSIACQRKSKSGGADFIQVVALGAMADTIQKWFSKGKGIIVECRINTGSYTNKDGKKVYTEEKLIESWEFAPIRKDEENSSPVENADSTQNSLGDTHTQESSNPPSSPDNMDFMSITEEDDVLPFQKK